MNISWWISSAHLGLLAELQSCSHARKMVCSNFASTYVVWIKSWRRTATLYLAFPTSLTAHTRQKSIQKLTSSMPTTWSESKRVTNGRWLSGLAMAPLNGTLWGLLKVFLPKACAQRSLCRWSLAQSFEATAIGSVTRVNLTNIRVWCMYVTVTVTVTCFLYWTGYIAEFLTF